MDAVFTALRVLVSLAVIIAAIWWVQRRLVRSGRSTSRTKPVSIVARQNLGNKTSVAVVHFGGKQFLLGVTEHGISVLDSGEVEVEVEVEAPALASVEDRPERATKSATEFATALGAAAKSTIAARRAPADREPALARMPPIADRSPLDGSVLSLRTWKQALSALRQGR